MNITAERIPTGSINGASSVSVSNPGAVIYGNNVSRYYVPHVMGGSPTYSVPPSNSNTTSSPPPTSATPPLNSSSSTATNTGVNVNVGAVLSGVGDVVGGSAIYRSGTFAEYGGEVLQGGLNRLGSQVVGDTAIAEVGETDALLEGAALAEEGGVLAAAGEGVLGAAEVGVASAAAVGLAPVVGAVAAAAAVGLGVYEIGENISWGGENVWEHAADTFHAVENLLPNVWDSWF